MQLPRTSCFACEAACWQLLGCSRPAPGARTCLLLLQQAAAPDPPTPPPHPFTSLSIQSHRTHLHCRCMTTPRRYNQPCPGCPAACMLPDHQLERPSSAPQAWPPCCLSACMLRQPSPCAGPLCGSPVVQPPPVGSERSSLQFLSEANLPGYCHCHCLQYSDDQTRQYQYDAYKK